MRKLLSVALVVVLVTVPLLAMGPTNTALLPASDATIQSDPMPPEIPIPGRSGLVPPTPSELLIIWA